MGSVVAHLSRTGAPDPDAVRRGLRAAPHRGHRGGVATRGSCAIGISRPDEPADAWLVDEPDLAVGLAGALDDVDRLGGQLAELGHPPTDASDPASVVAAAWRAWGAAAPERLRGPLTAAVTDGRRLWTWRDQVGYRTLFYRDHAQAVIVGSEAKQVAAAAGLEPEPDLDVLEHVFFTDYGDDTPAALKGIRRLPKASQLRADADGAAVRRYWHPDRVLETGRYGDHELAERFDALMAQAVDRAFLGPDAVSLSGGIDSPAIAGYGAERHLERFGTPLGAITAVFPDQPAVDESAYVELITSRLAMPMHPYHRMASPTEDLQGWAVRFDGLAPVFAAPDARVQYDVARELGYRNVLGGFAAELVIDMRHSLLAHLVATGRVGEAVARARAQLDKGARPAAVARQLVAVAIPRVAYRAYRGLRPPRRGTRVPPWVDRARVNVRAVRETVAPRGRWSQTQLGGFTGPGLSVEAHEVVQEVCGVRARRPWTDVDLWELFLSLPAEQKFPDVRTKGLVRRLLRGRVPDEILDRTDKTVFNDSVAARIDYDDLRRWLPGPRPLLAGIDYELLEKRLTAEDMGVFEYLWAKDLAGVHAFVAWFEGDRDEVRT